MGAFPLNGRGSFRIPFPGFCPPKRTRRRASPVSPPAFFKRQAGNFIVHHFAGLLLGARLPKGEGAVFSLQRVFPLLVLPFPLRELWPRLILSGRPGRRHVLPSTTGSLPIPPCLFFCQPPARRSPLQRVHPLIGLGKHPYTILSPEIAWQPMTAPLFPCTRHMGKEGLFFFPIIANRSTCPYTVSSMAVTA